MSFIVIEGDNGTGKDTLALGLSDRLNHNIITNFSDVIAMNKLAKEFTGLSRIEKFVNYNKFCSSLAEKGNCISVRYWLSTVAAAYADGVFSYDQSLEFEKNFDELKRPNVIVFLWCDYSERVTRIEKRRSEDFDDLTVQRNDRYKYYLTNFQYRTNIPFVNINTTGKFVCEVLEIAVESIIKIIGDVNGN